MRRTPMKRTGFAGRRAQARENEGNRAEAIDGAGFVATNKIVSGGLLKSEPNRPQVLMQHAQKAIKKIAFGLVDGPMPKSRPVRNETYRRTVASLPCVICRVPGYSQAAHGSAGKGMGIKACDLTLFPACCDRPGVRGCHSQLDQGAMFSKAVRHELEPVWAADTQRRIYAMGLWPKGVPYPHQQEH